MIISSDADHGKVSSQNPHWTEFDWCRYWELDARKAYKKSGSIDPGRRMYCDDERCQCVKLNRKNK